MFSLGSGASDYTTTMQKHIYISLFAAITVFSAPAAYGHTSYAVDIAYENLQYQAEYIRVAQRKISPSEAKSIARKKVRGAEVIDISIKSGKYKVRMQKKNGQVVDVYVDAATGRVR